jgi:hypothetical protein
MEEQSREDNKNVDDNNSPSEVPGATPAPQGVSGGSTSEQAESNAISQNAAKLEPGEFKRTAGKKKITICVSCIAVLIVALLIVGYLFFRNGNSGAGTQNPTNESQAVSNVPPVTSNEPQATPQDTSGGADESRLWLSNNMIAVYIAAGVVAAAVGVWVFLRRTFRTRLKMQKEMKLDPDITDWLIIFNWTPKILYAPTIAASFVASLIMFLNEADIWFFSSIPAVVIGGIWLAIFFVNFLVEEYSMSIKILIIVLVSLGCFLLWLNLLGWVTGFLRLFKYLALSVNATGYLLVGIIGLFTILVSWLKGLFYYLAITPNYMNLQEGATESGEQIGREDYNSRIDTSDFLERLMGFGRIIITFKDKKREPISVLTWRIQKKAQMLERVRGKFAIDYPQQTQPKI